MFYILLTSLSIASSNYTCGYLKLQYASALIEGETSGCCGKSEDTVINPEVDISGYGTCDGDTLNITKAWEWTQYPSELDVTAVLTVDPDFVNKNAILWNEMGMYGFVIAEITNGTIIRMKIPQFCLYFFSCETASRV